MANARRILKNLSVINILLAAALLLFADYAVLPLFGKGVAITTPAPIKKQTAATASPTDKPAEVKSPSPSDYIVIADQNLFNPERKIPVEKKAEAPLPKPEFVLYGTLKTDDLHLAYMEDKKAPQNTPARGKRQIPVRLGETLSGFTLKEIGPDRVVMARGEEKLTVLLNDSARPKTREMVAGVPGAQPGVAPHRTPPAAFANQQQPAQAVSRPSANQQRQPAQASSTRPSAETSTSQQPPLTILPPASAPPVGTNPRDAFYKLFNRR